MGGAEGPPDMVAALPPRHRRHLAAAPGSQALIAQRLSAEVALIEPVRAGRSGAAAVALHGGRG
jgi:hypothetical protein